MTLGRETRDELAEAFATDGLGEVVEDLVRTGRHTVLPPDATEAAGARMPPQLGMASTQLVALTALDPDVARMLGLLYHDPVETGTYDYKVVAHHGEARHPSRLVTFDSLPAGPLDVATAGFAGVAFAGTAGLEVLAPGTDGRTKLRVAEPLIGTAAGIRFDPPVPAVTVRLDVVGGVPLAAWRGSQQVDSAVPFFDVALLEDAGGIDAITWSTGPVDLVELEIYEDTGTLGDVAAYAWRLSPTAPAPVHELELTEVGAAAEPARLHPDGTVDSGTSVVGLDWGESTPLQDAGRPVRAHAGRAATATDPLEVRNADQPAPAFADRRRSLAGPGRAAALVRARRRPGHVRVERARDRRVRAPRRVGAGARGQRPRGHRAAPARRRRGGVPRPGRSAARRRAAGTRGARRTRAARAVDLARRAPRRRARRRARGRVPRLRAPRRPERARGHRALGHRPRRPQPADHRPRRCAARSRASACA